VKQTLIIAKPLRFAKTVVLVGIVVMIVAVASFLCADFYPVFASDTVELWFSNTLLAISAFGALTVLSGYILVAWELSPAKATFFGAASVGVGLALPFVLEMLEPLAERFPGPLTSHEAAPLYGSLLGVFVICGTVAFVFGLIRFCRRYWRKL
jgi:hypothetical protein